MSDNRQTQRIATQPSPMSSAMGSPRSSYSQCLSILVLALCLSSLSITSRAQATSVRGLEGQFNKWTPSNLKFSKDGRGVELVLDKYSAAGMGSKRSWLYGGFGAWIKLPAGNSAGTVTTLYMTSPGPHHCELDFEFLGNETGEPFLLHTNVFVDGVGGREQQIYLGFDPSAAFHYYNFQWNKDLIVFYVDNTPVRMFRNLEGIVPGFKYPNHQAMGLFLSIWDGSSWATQGGLVKLDWNAAPFVATYQNFRLNGCVVESYDSDGIRKCQNTTWAAPGPNAQRLPTGRVRQMRAVRQNQVKYNYCDDRKRYPSAPPECAYNVL